ncbi:radical SAM protein [Rhizobium leguminosarum]|uniref:radical SAM protein n=1 Tax=Rhizobium leguminosarum TaxID=384 RepID=UPI001C95F1B1|nr:radical SAM protein [Rhizobium leguminosarum]MBY5539303.1 radical SAM protein [Rhizobium leguminosarum]
MQSSNQPVDLHIVGATDTNELICVVPAARAWFKASENFLKQIVLLLPISIIDSSSDGLNYIITNVDYGRISKLSIKKCIAYFEQFSTGREQEGLASLLRSPAISITDLCNIKCAYCYVEAPGVTKSNRKQVQFEGASSFIEAIAKAGSKTVQFFGGEPSTYSELPQLIEKARSEGLDVRISSNGISSRLRSPAYKAAVSDRNVHWRISLDSHIESKNDLHRGKGTYSSIMKNLEYLASADSYVSLKCVLSEGSLEDLEGYLDFAASFGFKVTYTIMFPVGDAKAKGMNASISEFDIVKELFSIGCRRPEIMPILNPSPFGFMLRSIFLRDALCVPRFTLYLHSDGNIYPMDSMIDEKYRVSKVNLNEENTPRDISSLVDLGKALRIQSESSLNGARCARCCVKPFCYVENSDSWEIPNIPSQKEFASCSSKRSAIKFLMLHEKDCKLLVRRMLPESSSRTVH